MYPTIIETNSTVVYKSGYGCARTLYYSLLRYLNFCLEFFVIHKLCICIGEPSPRPFSKKSKLNASLDQQSKAFYSLFLLYAKLRAIEIYWNQAADLLLLPLIKFFKKQKGVPH